MAGLELVLILLAVSAGLRIVAERVSVPFSALLVVGGLLLALTPGLPHVELSPDVLFVVFVPPLLYSGAVAFPLRDFRGQLGPIVRLSVLMVLASTAIVAVTAHELDAGFTWPAAFILGAIVSPPDPVAVLSVMRSLRVPRAVESLLEGEGLLNDATALVTYRLAVAAAVTGVFSPWIAAAQFFAGAAGGIAIGVIVALLVIRALRLTQSVPVAENTVSLLTPFVAYLPAERLHVSGVIAVVAAAMTVARTGPRVASPTTRVQNAAMWTVVTFLLESLVFIIVGLQLPSVMHALEHYPLRVLLQQTVAVTLCLVLVRFAWVMPTTYAARALGRWLRGSKKPLPPWRSSLFVAWAGLRGGDSLVIALALPFTTAAGAPFPARDQIVFITFGVIFATLVLQGPTLAPIARLLGLRGTRGVGLEASEEAHARLTAAEAGLRALTTPALAQSPHPEVVREVEQQHIKRAQQWASREATLREPGASVAETHTLAAGSPEAGVLAESREAEYRRIRTAMIAEEREALIRMRDAGEIGDGVMRDILRDLDFESIMLEHQSS